MTFLAPTPQEITDFLAPLDVEVVEFILTDIPQILVWRALTSVGPVTGTAEIKTDQVGSGVRMWTELRVLLVSPSSKQLDAVATG